MVIWKARTGISWLSVQPAGKKNVISNAMRKTVGVEESTQRKRVIVDAVREAMKCRVEQPAAPEQARGDGHCVNSAHRVCGTWG
jgi:hypothetical protein